MPTSGHATYTGTMAAIENTPDTKTTPHRPLTAEAAFTRATLQAEARLAHTTTDTPWGTITLAPGTTTSTKGHTGTTTGQFAGPTATAIAGITTLHATFEATRD